MKKEATPYARLIKYMGVLDTVLGLIFLILGVYVLGLATGVGGGKEEILELISYAVILFGSIILVSGIYFTYMGAKIESILKGE